MRSDAVSLAKRPVGAVLGAVLLGVHLTNPQPRRREAVGGSLALLKVRCGPASGYLAEFLMRTKAIIRD